MTRDQNNRIYSITMFCPKCNRDTLFTRKGKELVCECGEAQAVYVGRPNSELPKD